MTVRDHISGWLIKKSLGVRPRTLDQYAHVCNAYILPAIGDMGNDDIADDMLYDVMARVPYTRTRQIVYSVLKMLYPSIMATIRKPIHDAEPPRWWSADQAQSYLSARKATGDDMYMCWVLAIYCGLRRGELVGLRWSDIDMAGGVIHVRNQRQHIKGMGIVDCKPKTRSSIRDIPIASTPVIDALLDHYTVCAAENVIHGRDNCPYVLSRHGYPVNPTYVDYALKRAIKDCGAQSVTCHQLRHTCATICITAGVPLNVVSALLGHGGVAITAAIYAHVQRAAVRDAISSVARELRHYDLT